MDENIEKEMLDELFSLLESMERQNAALRELLKSKGIVSDEELASHLEEAKGASSVRWLAARVRIDHLISGAKKAEQRKAEGESPKFTETSADGTRAVEGKEQPQKSQDDQPEGDARKTAESGAPKATMGDAGASKDPGERADAGKEASGPAPENAA